MRIDCGTLNLGYRGSELKRNDLADALLCCDGSKSSLGRWQSIAPEFRVRLIRLTYMDEVCRKCSFWGSRLERQWEWEDPVMTCMCALNTDDIPQPAV